MDSRFSVSLSYVQLWSCWFSKVASKLWENALCSDVFEWLLYTPHPHTQLCIICTIVCDCCVILCVDIKHKVSMEKQVEYMMSQIIHMLIFFPNNNIQHCCTLHLLPSPTYYPLSFHQSLITKSSRSNTRFKKFFLYSRKN